MSNWILADFSAARPVDSEFIIPTVVAVGRCAAVSNGAIFRISDVSLYVIVNVKTRNL